MSVPLPRPRPPPPTSAQEPAEPEPKPEPVPEPVIDHWALNPFLPRPENRDAVLRALRAACMRVCTALALFQAKQSLRTGRAFALETMLSLESVDAELTLGSPLNVVGMGLAAAAAVVGGLDTFSAAGSSGVLHESASAWLNGARATSFGFRDRIAVVMHALLTAIGHEVLFRGAVPSLAQALFLKQFPESSAAAQFGGAVSVVAYSCIHPSIYAFFAAFAAVWLAIAAYCGGLTAAVIASVLSQLGASSLYYHATARSARNKAQEGKQQKGKKDVSKSTKKRK